MIVTLSGTNTFALNSTLKATLQKFVDQFGDIGVERLSGDNKTFDEVVSAVQSLPFLASKKLVILTDIVASKDLADKIEQLLDAVIDETDLIIVEPKFDKRSRLYKTLKKLTDFQEFNELGEWQLAQWLVAEAANAQASLSASDANYLMQRVGNSQLRLKHEIEKLALYSTKITRHTIDLLCVPSVQTKVFDLLDAVFAGRQQAALKIYQEQRLQKVEPQAILATIAWQLHVLSLVKAAGDRSAEEIAKEAKLNPFAVSKSLAIAQKITTNRVKEMVQEALQLDVRLKTLRISADEAVQNYLLEISN